MCADLLSKQIPLVVSQQDGSQRALRILCGQVLCLEFCCELHCSDLALTQGKPPFTVQTHPFDIYHQNMSVECDHVPCSYPSSQFILAFYHLILCPLV